MHEVCQDDQLIRTKRDPERFPVALIRCASWELANYANYQSRGSRSGWCFAWPVLAQGRQMISSICVAARHAAAHSTEDYMKWLLA